MENKRYCKRHPTHKQSKGVCPSCLIERLSHLSASSSSSTTNHSNSSSATSNYSPNYSSDSNLSSVATGSPLHRELQLPNKSKNKNNKKKKSLSFLLRGSEESSNKANLKKSRSLAFVVEEEEVEKKKKQRKKGRRFWSKVLMMGVSRGTDHEMKKDGSDGLIMMHSKTVKEKPSAKWVFFS